MVFRFLSVLLFLLFAQSSYAKTKVKIIFLGDSITAGYGIAKVDSFPYLIDQALKKDKALSAKYEKIEIVNSGISGSTSASGLKRLKWVMKSKPTHIVLALGGNDVLRGFNINVTKSNFEKMIEYVQTQNVKLLLVGMQAPPNLGANYASKFNQVFPRLAKKYKVPLMPFLLEGVAGEQKLNLPDRIHPNEEGYKIISKNVLKYLRPLL